METDGKASTLQNLLHNPDISSLSSSPDLVEKSSEQHSQARKKREQSPARLQGNYDPGLSSELSGMTTSPSPEVRHRSPLGYPPMAARRNAYGKQEAEDYIEEEELSQMHLPQTRRKSVTTFSPDHVMLQDESASPEQRKLDEFIGEDGNGRKGTILPPDLSFQKQARVFHPVYAQKPKSTPLQQAPVTFEKDENTKSKLHEDVSGTIGAGKISNVHPLEQIEKSIPHKLTLQLWLEEERLLRSEIQAHESDLNRTEQEIYQILGFDVLFQAITIAGASQATVLDCTTAWVPLVLSIAASFATFLAVFRKLGSHERISVQLQSEQSNMRTLFECVERLKSLGGLFDLNDVPGSSLTKGSRNNRNQDVMKKVLEILWSYKFFVLVVLLVFSILALVSFKKILCSR